ncbi:MAG: DUF3825 domain-containing protein [Oscillospiraceae bacterium]|nr:DUF3825 domain-containing protein [Oscillospiraceae bacterium]
MLSSETKSALYSCIIKQFPDAGLYRISRIGEWLHTNGYSYGNLGYGSFRALAEDFPEMFSFQDDNNDEFIEIKKWQAGEKDMYGNYETNHPADSFFGKGNIILNDDIIEMSQRSLYALTKILGNGYTVQQMKQEIYEKFDEAKENNKLDFFGERYTFPIDYCRDGMLVNGIITKNISPYGKSLYFSFDKTQIQRPAYEDEEERKVPVGGPVPKEDVDRVYKLLTENFECDRRLHMATVSKFLTDRGVDRMRYGYFKMKDFLADMDFIELEEQVLGGVPQFMVTIHADRAVPAAPVSTPTPVRSVQSYEKTPTYERPQHKDISTERGIPSGRLSDFCNLPAKPMSILENYASEKGFQTDYYRLIDTLNEDYENARLNGKVKSYDSKIIFPLRFNRDDGSPVELTLKPSAYEGKGWFLYFVDTVVRERSGFSGDPGKQLENFAFLGSWSGFLSELANKAVDEQWDFVEGPNRRYQILQQYIKYTFSRLTREKKICISGDKQFAAFNTGLADNHYDDIYACFTQNDSVSDTEWRFAGFCTAASGGLGKQLVNYFNPLPMPPSYFKHNEDLFFDHTKQLHTDFEHIIIDNIKRLPIQFLYDQFFDNVEARELVEKIRECSDRYIRNSLYSDLKSIIFDNSRLFMRIQNRIKDSIELARKRVRWNYKTAVPSYFPKRDSMSLMLPLALQDESTPDVALVVELTRSGSYQGQTILTLPQAYIDARLMCRLTGDWLVPEKLISIVGEEHDFSASEEELADME